jgi:hypothetical protein
MGPLTPQLGILNRGILSIYPSLFLSFSHYFGAN